MIKTVFKYLLILVCMSLQTVYADALRINDLTFDNSDSFIVLNTSITEETGKAVIKKGVLENPGRVYLDIENAVLTKKQTVYDFKNGRLSSLKISQFSTTPNIVRIVMTYNSELRPEDVKVISIGGSIIIKLQNYKPTQDYLTPIYREVKTSVYDYFEKVRVYENSDEPVITPLILQPANPVLSGDSQNVVQQPDFPVLAEPVRQDPPLKEPKLLSRFFLSDAFVKQNALLLTGTGIVNLEKVFYLSNPSRVVFDIPNAVSAIKIRNRELQLSEDEFVKIGQFEPTKVRVVITTPEPKKYLPIYSNDLQNILIARKDRLQDVSLYSSTTDISSVTTEFHKEYRSQVDKLNIEFTDPIVHSLKRNDNSFELNLYNVNSNQLAMLTSKLKSSSLKNVITDKISHDGISILIPAKDNTTFDCVENLTATKLVLTIKNPIAVDLSKKNLSKKVVVIDAGHGGSDPGAVRENVEEKVLTIKISDLIAERLKDQGALVYMTRCDDTFVSLNDRVEYSNKIKPDIFVSVHINASEKSDINGIETHYYKDDSIDFAKDIHKAMVSKIDANNRGVLKSRFYVIKNTDAPSVLLELGFISNEEERNLLLTNQRQEDLADAVTEGIINYLNKTGTN